MVMGTLANLYAIQQSFSTIQKVDRDIVDVKDIISVDLIANELAKQQLNDKSTYVVCFYIFVTETNCLFILIHFYKTPVYPLLIYILKQIINNIFMICNIFYHKKEYQFYI